METPAQQSIVLIGPDNYLRWLASFKATAKSEGFYGIFTGEEEILERPSIDEYLNINVIMLFFETGAGSKSITACQSEGSDHTDVPLDKAIQDPNYLEKQEWRYKVAIQRYEDQYQRVTRAKDHLAKTLSISIRCSIIGMNPKQAFDHLAGIYRVPEDLGLMQVSESFHRVELCHSNDMNEYFNKINDLRQDFHEFGKELSDEDIIRKIVSGLSPGYDSWKQAYHIILSQKHGTKPNLLEIQAELIFLESQLKTVKPKTEDNISEIHIFDCKHNHSSSDSSDSSSASSSVSSDTESDDSTVNRPANRTANRTGNRINLTFNRRVNGNINRGINRNTKKPRDQCTYYLCRKWGHKEENCWLKFPAKRPVRGVKVTEAPRVDPLVETFKTDMPTEMNTELNGLNDFLF